MAISLFAAGVIWRVMYEKDPDQGAVNAAIGVVKDAFSTPAHSRTPGPRPRPWRAEPDGPFVLAEPVEPGRRGAAGSHRDHDVRDPRRTPSRPSGPRRSRAGSPASSGETSSRAEERTGVVEEEELGLPGLTVELRDDSGSSVASSEHRDRRPVRLRQRRPRRLSGRHPREHVRRAVRGLLVARAEPDHAGDHDRVHLGLGGLLDGRHRRGLSPPSRATCSRRRARTAPTSGRSSGA